MCRVRRNIEMKGISYNVDIRIRVQYGLIKSIRSAAPEWNEQMYIMQTIKEMQQYNCINKPSYIDL